MFDDAIDVITPGVRTTRAGDEIADWDDPAAVEHYDDVSIQPAARSEDVSSTRDATLSTWQLISAPGVDIDLTAVQRIRWDGVAGRLLEVVGEVGRWPDPLTGRPHHVEAVLQLAEG